MKTHQTLSNTEILFFVLGYQGGTIHQLAEELEVSTSDILDADYDKMQELMRVAQRRPRWTDALRDAGFNILQVV